MRDTHFLHARDRPLGLVNALHPRAVHVFMMHWRRRFGDAR